MSETEVKKVLQLLQNFLDQITSKKGVHATGP